jgi:hypothetical protein
METSVVLLYPLFTLFLHEEFKMVIVRSLNLFEWVALGMTCREARMLLKRIPQFYESLYRRLIDTMFIQGKDREEGYPMVSNSIYLSFVNTAPATSFVSEKTHVSPVWPVRNNGLRIYFPWALLFHFKNVYEQLKVIVLVDDHSISLSLR